MFLNVVVWKEYSGHWLKFSIVIQETEVLHEILTEIYVLGLVCFLFSILESSKLQNAGRKQSVSRSLKHLFHSSNKFVKTLKRFVIHFISQTFWVLATSCCSYITVESTLEIDVKIPLPMKLQSIRKTLVKSYIPKTGAADDRKIMLQFLLKSIESFHCSCWKWIWIVTQWNIHYIHYMQTCSALTEVFQKYCLCCCWVMKLWYSFHS